MRKVVKFGGSSMANAKQYEKVKRIVQADSDRDVVVVSAAGKRFKEDHKITDLLYLCYAAVFGPYFSCKVPGYALLVSWLALVLALISWLIAGPLVRATMSATRKMEGKLQKMSTQDLLSGAIGLIIGLIIAFFIGNAVSGLPIVGTVIAVFVYLIFGYLGLSLGVKKREELVAFISSLGKENNRFKAKGKTRAEGYCNMPKVLDTSVIIDGRIADIDTDGAGIGLGHGKLFILQRQLVAGGNDHGGIGRIRRIRRFRRLRGFRRLRRIRGVCRFGSFF